MLTCDCSDYYDFDYYWGDLEEIEKHKEECNCEHCGCDLKDQPGYIQHTDVNYDYIDNMIDDCCEYDEEKDEYIIPESLQKEIDYLKNTPTFYLCEKCGDPVENVIWTLSKLGEIFGTYVNGKGFKSLPKGLAIIQGDGIDFNSLKEITDALVENKWTLDSVAFGSGGGLLQKVNRDTQRFAMKASSVKKSGSNYAINKAPKTDVSKASKAGKLKLVRTDNGFKTENYLNSCEDDEMRLVFLNGHIQEEYSFVDVRDNWKKTVADIS